MQKLEQRLQQLEQDAYWRWFENCLHALTNEELVQLYSAVENAPDEVENEELNTLLWECQHQER